MAFTNFYITNQGSALLAKAQIGGSLTYTRAAAGDGQLGTQQPTVLTALIDKVMDLSISGYDGSTPGVAAVEITFSNQNAPNPFYWREIGLFAKGDDGAEILYAYGNAGDNADFIPSYGVTPIEFLYYLSTKIGNAANVTATIDSSLVYAKKSDVDAVSLQVKTLDESLSTRAEADLVPQTLINTSTAFPTGTSDTSPTPINFRNGSEIEVAMAGNTTAGVPVVNPVFSSKDSSGSVQAQLSIDGSFGTGDTLVFRDSWAYKNGMPVSSSGRLLAYQGNKISITSKSGILPLSVEWTYTNRLIPRKINPGASGSLPSYIGGAL